MKKRKNVPQKKGIDYGKKKFRIVDPAALTISVLTAAILGTLAALSHAYGFNQTWYGDLITAAVCVIGFFALLNIGYVLMEGITVEYGSVFVGVDENRKPISFSAKELVGISLWNERGESLSMDASRWWRVSIRFELQDGSACEYDAHLLTRRQLQAIRTYFGK